MAIWQVVQICLVKWTIQVSNFSLNWAVQKKHGVIYSTQLLCNSRKGPKYAQLRRWRSSTSERQYSGQWALIPHAKQDMGCWIVTGVTASAFKTREDFLGIFNICFYGILDQDVKEPMQSWIVHRFIVLSHHCPCTLLLGTWLITGTLYLCVPILYTPYRSQAKIRSLHHIFWKSQPHIYFIGNFIS